MVKQRYEARSVMGRRFKDPGAIPHMRKRVRGKTTYYFFDHGGKPRRETALGKSYPEAVRKWAELMATEAAVPEIVTFRDAVKRYKQLVIPKKRASTAKVNLAELAEARRVLLQSACATGQDQAAARSSVPGLANQERVGGHGQRQPREGAAESSVEQV